MGIIIIFGHTNDIYGSLSGICHSRIKKAVQVMEHHPDYKIVVTGGFGEHFNITDKPHHYYIFRELAKCGVNNSCFLKGIDSNFTLKDVTMSKEFLSSFNLSEIILVTSDFHASRVACFALEHFIGTKISIITSSTPVDSDEFFKLKTHEYKTLKKSLNYMMVGEYE